MKTNNKFILSEALPTDLSISTPLTFAFIGENLVLTKNKKKNDRWDILGGKLRTGETWIQGLKREALEEAGVVIDHISVVGYLNTSPVTISFVQEVKKEWQKYKTLEREHFSRKWAKKALLDRGDDHQLADIFTYVLSYWDKQKYDYSFEYVEGSTPLDNIQNTGSMVFVRTSSKKFLIVRDFDENFFSLPGGGCDMNEDGKECAVREVREEAQVEVKNIFLIGTVIVKISKNGQVFSVSTQQRYLADAAEVPGFVVNPDSFDERRFETVERKEVPFESLCEEVKLLRNKTGETTLYSLKRMFGV
ncbi:MAG: NUDIX domain-containing protein [Patescibacteria group bacterium]